MSIHANFNSRVNTFNQNQSLLNSFNSINNNRSVGFGNNAFDPFAAFNMNFGVNNAAASADVRSFLTGMRSTAERLGSAMDRMRGTGRETVVASDPNALSIRTASPSARIDDVNIRIQQVASGQVNQGTSLEAGRRVSVSDARTHRFEIEQNGQTHELSFRVGVNYTQEDMQNAMARAINNANIGVTASVDTSNDSRNSTLTVQSRESGFFADGRNEFAIRDVSGGRAVAMAGVGTQTQRPQDAEFSVNGGTLQTSRSNDVDLGNGVTATLRQAASNREITVGMGRERNISAENVNEMVRQFNTLLTNTADNRGDRGVNRLHHQLAGLSTSSAASLAQVGISVDREGFMSVNSSRLNTAIENGSLDRFLNGDSQGASFGFANRLARIAEDVSSNPHRYMSRESLDLLEPSGSAFARPGHNTGSMLDSMRISRQNRIFTMGLLLDMFI
ncbi:MAG: hypothetical protein FWE24_03335 [Defluviitaleaceae bacterium]|nr:hypothetical protein [Defluviitaleaceae bacterium]